MRVGGAQVNFKMRCWRHWRLVWAQMRSFRDPERLLDDLLEVMRGSCSAGAWPGWLGWAAQSLRTGSGGGNSFLLGPTRILLYSTLETTANCILHTQAT